VFFWCVYVSIIVCGLWLVCGFNGSYEPKVGRYHTIHGRVNKKPITDHHHSCQHNIEMYVCTFTPSEYVKNLQYLPTLNSSHKTKIKDTIPGTHSPLKKVYLKQQSCAHPKFQNEESCRHLKFMMEVQFSFNPIEQ